MQITIRFTQKQTGATKDHVLECSDSETYANGHPVPSEGFEEWAPIVENIDSIANFEVLA